MGRIFTIICLVFGIYAAATGPSIADMKKMCLNIENACLKKCGLMYHDRKEGVVCQIGCVSTMRSCLDGASDEQLREERNNTENRERDHGAKNELRRQETKRREERKREVERRRALLAECEDLYEQHKKKYLVCSKRDIFGTCERHRWKKNPGLPARCDEFGLEYRKSRRP